MKSKEGKVWKGTEEFVARFPKTEYQKPSVLSQVMNVSTNKWEDTNMDFVVGFSKTRILYRLTKSANFIPVKSTYSAEEYARMYIDEIVSYICIPLSII